MRLVGRALLSSADGRLATKAGSVVETDEGALFLWLYAYPLQGQDIDLSFDMDFGEQTNEVSVLTDYQTQKEEFIVGEIRFFGTRGKLKLFSLPVFQATLVLQRRDTSRLKHEMGSASYPAVHHRSVHSKL